MSGSGLTELSHAIAGALGGIVSLAATYPLLTIATRKQIETKKTIAVSTGEKSVVKVKRENFVEKIRKIISKEGWQALYSGLGPALVGVTFTQFIYYFCY